MLVMELWIAVALAARPPMLEVTGACPGANTIAIRHLAPGGSYKLFTSTTTGNTPIPSGPCAGTNTGLGPPVDRGTWTADAAGTSGLGPNLPGGICGQYVVGVDLGTCETTNPDRFGGMLYWLPLDGDATELIAGRNGTITDAYPIPDRYGTSDGAMYFDGGLQAYIEVPGNALPVGTEPRTVTAWMRPEQFAADNFVVHWGQSGYCGPHFGVGNGSFRTSTGGGCPPFASDHDLPDFQWHFVAVVWDGSGAISVSTNSEVQTATNPFSATGTGNLFLGAYPSQGRYWYGGLDDVRVYDWALPPAKLRALDSAGPR